MQKVRPGKLHEQAFWPAYGVSCLDTPLQNHGEYVKRHMKIRIPTVVTILMLATFSSPPLAAYKEGMDALAVRDYAWEQWWSDSN